jgi:hypothetical protein
MRDFRPSSCDNETEFWDYVSSMTQKQHEDTIKDLFSASFHFIKPTLDRLCWIDSNYLYMNLVCGVSQVKIAEVFGVSQLGVSKRIRTAVRKIRNEFKKPEVDPNQVRRDLSMLVDRNYLETAVIYYQVKTFSVTSKIVGGVKEGSIRIRMINVTDQLAVMSKMDDLKSLKEAVRGVNPLKVNQVLQRLDSDPEFPDVFTSMAFRYHEYFKVIMSMNYYSDFVFKKTTG